KENVNTDNRQTGVLNVVLNIVSSRAYRRAQYFIFACWIVFIIYSFSKYGESIMARRMEDEEYFPKHKPRINKKVINLGDDGIKLVPKAVPISTDIIPIVVFAYQRDEYLKKCLDTIFKYLPKKGFQVFVSQDGNHEGVANTARSYGDKVTLFQRERKIIIEGKPLAPEGYYSLAQHYKFAIDKIFNLNKAFKKIIILEEDIEVAVDFFDYFSATAPLLDKDTSLFCVSAWNDNGMNAFVNDNRALYRSDFFPGLGWMTTRKFWEEVGPKWPLGFWDDWLRDPDVRKGRACIRPEISRTYTFGAKGVSLGQFYEQYLKHIKLNQVPVDWSGVDLSYLEKDIYDRNLINDCENAESIHVDNLSKYDDKNKHFKMYYSNTVDFESISKKIGIMSDIKAGVPRGAYGGVVTFKYKTNVLHIVPDKGAMKPVTYKNERPYK
ncbi:alpha-1,3-mannosyl-glycoprotein beta, partial [Acrasis kona]